MSHQGLSGFNALLTPMKAIQSSYFVLDRYMNNLADDMTGLNLMLHLVGLLVLSVKFLSYWE